jgi:hypothetical protein
MVAGYLQICERWVASRDQEGNQEHEHDLWGPNGGMWTDRAGIKSSVGGKYRRLHPQAV